MIAPPVPMPRRLPAPFTRAVALSLWLLGLAALGLIAIPAGELRTAFSDVMAPLTDLLATVLLLVAAWRLRRHSRRAALGWAVLGGASLLYALGDLTWGILEIGLKTATFPSLADGFYLAYYAAFLAGVYIMTFRQGHPGSWIHDSLDLAVILAAAILGFGNFLIGPVLQSNAGAPLGELAILAAYPVGDLVMLGAVLLLLYHYRGQVATPASEAGQKDGTLRVIPVLLLAAGMLVMIVTDGLYTYQTLLGTYSSGGLLDLGWLAAELLIGLAGVAQWCSLQPGNALSEHQPGPRFHAAAQWLKTYLPYAWLLAAFALLVISGVKPLPMSFAAITLGVSAVLVLVLIRQFLTLSENARLTLRMSEQAARLESINRNLNLEIAERVRVQEKLAFDVLHDQVTGLANRRLFLDRLGQSIKRSHRHRDMSFAVLFMDLDQFKLVNDTLGHSVGDQLLISVGRRLEATLRSGDTVARFGGDEYAILLEDLEDPESAERTAEKVRQAVAAPFRLKDRDVHVTASIGIATDVTKYEYPDDLLRDVDLAMYQAKADGKARCKMFRMEMRDRAFSRMSLEEDLRCALLNGEFELFYQPISSLESDELVGLEALLRWRHPQRGLLLPAEFLQVAEESDLILPLGEWILNEACRQMKAWHTAYPDLSSVCVNVNLSNREFGQPQLVEKVCRALDASGLPGSALRLEITERVLVENYPLANQAVMALNDMGVKLEVDDFGTGYSALSYLQQLPIHAIKIDKSFISDMRGNRKGLGLVRAMVSMARELGMLTIAEGIETGEQLNELKGLLCGFGQGFLLSEPLSAADTEAALRNRQG